jgi:hypothetical protein
VEFLSRCTELPPFKSKPSVCFSSVHPTAGKILFQQTLPESRVRQVFSVYNLSKEFTMNVNKTMFGLGLLIALTAATLLVLGVIESGVAAAIGMLGIGLIAASGRVVRSKQ